MSIGLEKMGEWTVCEIAGKVLVLRVRARVSVRICKGSGRFLYRS